MAVSEREESSTQVPHEDIDDPSDLTIEETPIGQHIVDRPEVKEASLHWGEGRVVILVTFTGWEIPAGFATDYQMYLESARIVDPRPTWKRIFNVGQGCYLEAKYVRDAGTKA